MLHNIAHHHRVRAKTIKKVDKNFPYLTKAVLFMAIAEPSMTAPQVYEVWVNHQTAGVSLATWGFMSIASVTWVIYSLKIKNAPMIISSLIWAVMEILIVIGIFVF